MVCGDMRRGDGTCWHLGYQQYSKMQLSGFENVAFQYFSKPLEERLIIFAYINESSFFRLDFNMPSKNLQVRRILDGETKDDYIIQGT